MEKVNLIPVRNFELVELPIKDNVSLDYSFPQTNIIDGRKVRAIVCYNASDLPKSHPSRNNNINDTARAAGFLILSIAGKDRVNRLPLWDLDPRKNNGRMVEFGLIQPDWSKSRIVFSDGTNLTAGQVVVLGVYFED